MYTVYCHTFPHGKVYIGLTKQKPEHRWNNGNGYKNSPHMDNAIQKWGWNNIDHDVIAEVETLDEAERLEKHSIAWFKSTDPNYGYNVLPGGNVAQSALSEETKHKISESNKGLRPTEDTRRKLSKSIRERWSDEEYRKKQSISRKRRAYLEKGRRLSEKTKQKISLAHKGKNMGAEHPCSKPVLQYTKDGEFVKRWSNAPEAERAGITLSKYISAAALGRGCRSAGGFVWKYESDVEKVIDKNL